MRVEGYGPKGGGDTVNRINFDMFTKSSTFVKDRKCGVARIKGIFCNAPVYARNSNMVTFFQILKVLFGCPLLRLKLDIQLSKLALANVWKGLDGENFKKIKL